MDGWLNDYYSSGILLRLRRTESAISAPYPKITGQLYSQRTSTFSIVSDYSVKGASVTQIQLFGF